MKEFFTLITYLNIFLILFIIYLCLEIKLIRCYLKVIIEYLKNK